MPLSVSVPVPLPDTATPRASSGAALNTPSEATESVTVRGVLPLPRLAAGHTSGLATSGTTWKTPGEASAGAVATASAARAIRPSTLRSPSARRAVSAVPSPW